MARKDWHLWNHATIVNRLCQKCRVPALFSSNSTAYERLQEIKTILRNSGANIRAWCAQDSTRTCKMQRQLKQWNNVLAPVNIQLRERNTPGELEVILFDVAGDLQDSVCLLQRAILLFHWLLATHNCVTAIRVDDWGVFQHAAHFYLFCDGLRQSRRLKSLKLCSKLRNLTLHQRLLVSMRRLRSLEEFACEALHLSDDSENTTELCSFVASNAKLGRLSVELFVGQSRGMWLFAQELARSESITDLRIDVTCLRAFEYNAFFNALKENHSLQSLRLVGSLQEPTVSVAAIARAAEGLTALVTLELSCFRVNTNEAWDLAMALSCSKTVQQLALLSCMQIFKRVTSVPITGSDWRIQPYLHLLRQATSLRKLTLSMSQFDKREQRLFFEALALNDVVEEVHIQDRRHCYKSDLCRAICETNTGSRVRIGTVCVTESSLESALMSLHIRDACILVEATALPGVAYSCLAQLQMLDTLATLSVNIAADIGKESAELLAQYLQETRLLVEVTMSFFAGRSDSLVLLEALAQNTSITTLVVDRWCDTRHTAQELAGVVCSSKRIRALTYHLTSRSPSPAFFSTLARYIKGNCTLISVKAYRLRASAKDWNIIQESLARNSTLLVHAAQYVAGCAVRKKGGAEALELLGLDHMLVSKVQEMASVDEEEAQRAIKSRLADLNDLHVGMHVAGVVGESVVCRDSAGGRPCLDTMPYECWRILRRCLRVSSLPPKVTSLPFSRLANLRLNFVPMVLLNAIAIKNENKVMGPKEWRLWKHAKLTNWQLSPEYGGPELFSSANEAYARLQEIKLTLANSGADFSAPCARGSCRPCELPRQLKQWNHVLAPVNIQLRERNSPGELELISFDVAGDLQDRACLLQRGLLLFHWLLTTHNCVTAIRVDDWGVFQLPAFFYSFCDGLHKSRRLRSLKLYSELRKLSLHTWLLAAMGCLRNIEEFACPSLQFPDEPNNKAALCEIVAKNAKLGRLDVELFVGRPRRMWLFAQQLARSAAITDLRIDVTCVRPNEHEAFSNALKENHSLQSLRLVGSLRVRTLSVAAIARAAEGLRALITLELSHFRVTTSEAWALAMSLSLNRTVQHLALLSCIQIFSPVTSEPSTPDESYGGAHWRIQPFVYILCHATSLRKLTLSLSDFSNRDRRVFFEALALNDVVEEVHIQDRRHCYSRDLCRAICETNTGSRVRIGTVNVTGRCCEELKRLHIRGACILVEATALPGVTYSCLAQLQMLYSLTTLSVNIAADIGKESAELLAQYLQETRLLVEVTMSFFAGRSDSLVLLEALAQNTSITTLVVDRWCDTRHTAQELAGVVCSSKRIRALTYHLTSRSPSPAFFSTLARYIKDNCTLISVKAYRLRASAKDWNIIQEALARNSTLLVHAAQYVVGCAVRKKEGAKALELLGLDHMLVSKVQEMASVDEEEAQRAISSRLADLNDLHVGMHVAGVVGESVVCRDSAGGRPCLDTMPYECWRILRRCLRVRYVVDSQMC
ncbi:hypothetical protein V5799_009199 [Amblyomma americanum]|uniref:Uncharacterized protein n=1 Tax=Amblyomma americanum TaxID=6943 RepID=A0AAQ4FB13_AMBAM